MQETRIIPRPSRLQNDTIVSMPRTAWYWLDDLVKTRFAHGGYRDLVKSFGTAGSCPQRLSHALSARAQEHCDRQMATLYGLANDNAPHDGYPPLRPQPSIPDRPDLSARMPSVYRLFHFMPHATFLTTVWERRNYHLRQS